MPSPQASTQSILSPTAQGTAPAYGVLAAGDISARLDRLPATRSVWTAGAGWC
ncbi:hypothetical protein PTE30175_03773 [Pandoraea terrae]|uniref:Uncharacterized protein n=1 Tax=Pandoraea terrae TaxID=1537710 RepID=A0A5E4XG55_9BURK|nr:hypothetical protein [Pandoraea terrae]VVE35379.1 hypothetical protein PTE30175_03773 [Pandoraea terrae]